MINGMENLDIELIRKDVKNLHEKLHTAFTKGRIEQMTKEDIENISKLGALCGYFQIEKDINNDKPK